MDRDFGHGDRYEPAFDVGMMAKGQLGPGQARVQVALYHRVVVQDDSSFEQWVTDQGGPEAVVAMVEDTRRQANEGLLRGFTDKDEFLAYLERHGRRSA